MTTDTQKTYTFNEEHDPAKPAYYWFQQPPEGLTFYAVFYTLACRWGRCTACSIPSEMSSTPISSEDIKRQIDYLFGKILTPEKKSEIRKMILAVGGSILDKETFPGECLEYLILKIREECPGIKIVTLETRAEYVDFNEMNRLKGMLNEWLSVDLEIAIGFEAFDETIRNDRLNKGLTNKAFEVFCGKLSEHNIGLKTFLMLKPLPDMTDDEAIRDNILSIDYLDKISKKYHIKINAHINPAYVARGTILERKYNEGTYSPPSLVDVCRVVLSAEDKDVSIFVGLNDEGLTHDDHRISKLSCREMMVRLEKFNQTQDFDLLREAIE